jgi:hypothetical protein
MTKMIVTDVSNEKQVVSKQRVADHGEVYTAKREVNAMLDLVKEETERIDSRFLEPACGNGNFLVEILNRKMEAVLRRHAKNRFEYDLASAQAVSSMYGVELLPDNVETCRSRLFDQYLNTYRKHNSDEVSPDLERCIRFLLKKNILCGDALTMLQQDGEPITFCEWTPIAGSMQFSRRDFQFDFLVNQTHQYSLFDEQGEAQSFDEPIKSYPPIHYTQLYRYEEQDSHSI